MALTQKQRQNHRAFLFYKIGNLEVKDWRCWNVVSNSGGSWNVRKGVLHSFCKSIVKIIEETRHMLDFYKKLQKYILLNFKECCSTFAHSHEPPLVSKQKRITTTFINTKQCCCNCKRLTLFKSSFEQWRLLEFSKRGST